MAFGGVVNTISDISNIVCGLITTGFGVSLAVSQKDYIDELKSGVKTQNKIYNFAYDTQVAQEQAIKDKEQLEKELLQASQRYINGVADNDDMILLATYLPESFSNVYIDKDTKKAVITVSKQEDDIELEQEAVSRLQNENTIHYSLIGAGILALIWFIRRRK